MVSSARLAIASVLLIMSAIASAPAQTNPDKTPSGGNITGKVTLKNKGIAGVVVFAEEQYVQRPTRSNYRGTTDQTGTYRIANVPAGTYTITPVAPSLAFENELTNNAIVVNEGETVEDVNFSMVPGGVITGKVTDAEGRPVIGTFVSLMPVETKLVSVRETDSIRTDDRGIYRAFGLSQGKYKVYVGGTDSLPGDEVTSYRQTFHLSATEAAKATVIEVTEGGETTNVDIVIGRAAAKFTVTGRILDAETGKPLPNVKYGVYRSFGDHGGSSVTGRHATNAKGEIRLENVLPGTYSVFIVPEDSGIRGDSASFEVVDHDVADLVIKAGKASSLSGVVVFEGADEAGPTIKPDSLLINAWVQSNERIFTGGMPHVVNPDGSFTIGGLGKGFTRFRLDSRGPNDRRQLALLRVERDGVVQPDGLLVKDGEQVTGLRLVVKYLTGAIHGQIKIEGDELLPNSRISIWINLTNAAGSGPSYFSSNRSPQLDSRKRFVVESLAPGTYEVNAAVFEPNRMDTTKIYKQEVTVLDNTVSEVTITIKKP
ncbi:MAG TPA: carboxypeptidase regulatory-like domain-containing protein [Pyrinomonadaceae bacterium]|nr:carboxypeptidase regulatory-like domain-containing protein [Pyrinomonadaceae bacterium]